AVALLASPLEGHAFSLATASPPVGTRLVSLGYPYTSPLTMATGPVGAHVRSNKVPVLDLKFVALPGSSGGPVLDAEGNVGGVNQSLSHRHLEVVDLAALVQHHPAQLCFGAIAGRPATVCDGGAPKLPVLEADDPPEVCIGYAITLPFQACPVLA